MQPARGHDIHLPAQQLLEFDKRAAEVKQGASFFQINEEVYVALRIIITTSNRTKYPHIHNPVLPGNDKDFLFSLLYFLEFIHGMAYLRFRTKCFNLHLQSFILGHFADYSDNSNLTENFSILKQFVQYQAVDLIILDFPY